MNPFHPTQQHPHHHEDIRSPWIMRIQGFFILLGCIAMSICLTSYHPAELETGWLKPHGTPTLSTELCTNIFGIFGLYLAAFYYFLLGAASWCMLPLLFILGLRRIIAPQAPWRKQWYCLIAMCLIAAAALSLQNFILQDWLINMGLDSVGGLIGALLGAWTLGRWFDRELVFCVLVLIHGCIIPFFFDHNLLIPFKVIGGDIATNWRKWQQHRASKKMWKKTAAGKEIPPAAILAPSPHQVLSHKEKPESKQDEAELPFFYQKQAHLSTPDGPTTLITRAEQQEHTTPAQLAARVMQGNGTSPSPKLKVETTIPKTKAAKAAKASKATRPTFVHPDDYPLPHMELLNFIPECEEDEQEARAEMAAMQLRIIETLQSFDIDVEAGDITRGPSITRYEIYPPRGMRINKITNLRKDLMLATSSETINILAPIPGKNTVGIELANIKKTPVFLRELLESDIFSNGKFRIPVALGKDVYGRTVIGDLAAMPHTLVAGTTGSGKSVCINSMIISMLYKFSPSELKLVLIDPKVVEMQPYKKLPHLACPVVTDPGRVIGALRWAVNEMEHRYQLFSKMGVRNFEDFNNRPEGYIPEEEEEDPFYNNQPIDYDHVEAIASDIERQADERYDGFDEDDEQGELDFEEDTIPAKLPYLVIIIDELADLMMVVKEDVENYIARLTQKARAAGIHLVVATQTPRSNVVTGIIKANIPSRIAFKVSSPLDSRIILDTDGAENLLGKGDFLFIPPGGISKMMRAQGAFVSDEEVSAVVKHCSSHARQEFVRGATTELEQSKGGEATATNGGRLGGKEMSAEDSELYTRCLNLVVTERKASTSLLQRRFSIGYGRAAKIMDMLEERGIISSPQGATRAREVLIEQED